MNDNLWTINLIFNAQIVNINVFCKNCIILKIMIHKSSKCFLLWDFFWKSRGGLLNVIIPMILAYTKISEIVDLKQSLSSDLKHTNWSTVLKSMGFASKVSQD